MLASVIALLSQFAPLIELVIKAILDHKVKQEDITAAVNDLIVKAGEAELKREFPDG